MDLAWARPQFAGRGALAAEELARSSAASQRLAEEAPEMGAAVASIAAPSHIANLAEERREHRQPLH